MKSGSRSESESGTAGGECSLAQFRKDRSEEEKKPLSEDVFIVFTV